VKMAKIISLKQNLNQDEEFIPLEQARKYIEGRKGNCISRKSLLQKIYRNDFPPGTVTKSMRGNYFFSKKFLLGFTTTTAA
jgi:hypothetical protein